MAKFAKKNISRLFKRIVGLQLNTTEKYEHFEDCNDSNSKYNVLCLFPLSRRGSLLSTAIFVYAATSPVNGYFGGSLYARMGGVSLVF